MKSSMSQNVVLLSILAAIFVGIYFYSRNLHPSMPSTEVVPTQGVAVSDYRNAAYLVEGRSMQLINGVSISEAAPGSAEKITTQYFGDGSSGDLNGDGKDDTAFLITQSTGGSGTFYYIAAALKTDVGYAGTNTIFIGDRISPQNTNISKGVITVNYAERKLGEPMTTIPSMGQSKYFKIIEGKLVASN